MFLIGSGFTAISYKTIDYKKSWASTSILQLCIVDENDFKGSFFNLPDPCAEAKSAIGKATTLSKDSNYEISYVRILHAAVDSKEHCISFGRDRSGNIITSSVTTGNTHGTHSQYIINRFADLHNHTSEFPPSSGDLYGLIDLAMASPTFETRYVITRNQIVYALAIINLQAARTFNASYPRVNNSDYQPAFPEDIVDEINKLKGWAGITDEMAMAFILEKYHTGIALLKRDSSGNFKRLNTILIIDSNGKEKYIANNCE